MIEKCMQPILGVVVTCVFFTGAQALATDLGAIRNAYKEKFNHAERINVDQASVFHFDDDFACLMVLKGRRSSQDAYSIFSFMGAFQDKRSMRESPGIDLVLAQQFATTDSDGTWGTIPTHSQELIARTRLTTRDVGLSGMGTMRAGGGFWPILPIYSSPDMNSYSIIVRKDEDADGVVYVRMHFYDSAREARSGLRGIEDRDNFAGYMRCQLVQP